MNEETNTDYATDLDVLKVNLLHWNEGRAYLPRFIDNGLHCLTRRDREL